MSDLLNLWIDVLQLSHKSRSHNCKINREKLHPVGKYLAGSSKILFQNRFASLSEDFIRCLPLNTEELVTDFESVFNMYSSMICPFKWEERIHLYLFKYCKWRKGICLSVSDVIETISNRRSHLLMEIIRITAIKNENTLSVLFECRCPIEEYLDEYGFSFVKNENSIFYISQEESWDLLLGNNYDL